MWFQCCRRKSGRTDAVVHSNRTISNGSFDHRTILDSNVIVIAVDFKRVDSLESTTNFRYFRQFGISMEWTVLLSWGI